MSRREPGPGRQGRHARDRLQATLGTPHGPALLDGPEGSEPFQFGGGEDVPHGTRHGHAIPGEQSPRAEAGPSGHADVMNARLRWRVGLRVAVLLAVLALCAAGGFWWQAAAGRPEVLPLSDVATGGSVGEASDDDGGGTARQPDDGETQEDPGAASERRLVVHVAGAVSKPGVVQLPSGSRVHQAIAAAGGAAPGAELDRLNLAQVLADGEKIHVPRDGEALQPDGAAGAPAEAGPDGVGGSTGGADGIKVNLNTATLEELDALPKVGPVLAQRILDWRQDHGTFKSVEELDAVDGVGPKMLEALLPLVTV